MVARSFKTLDIFESILVHLVCRPSKTVDVVERIQVKALPDLPHSFQLVSQHACIRGRGSIACDALRGGHAYKRK